jgi:hypothetical protein
VNKKLKYAQVVFFVGNKSWQNPKEKKELHIKPDTPTKASL